MRARAATAAGVLSLAAAVSATGSAIINNHCSHDVYLWPISVDDSPPSATIIKSGSNWSQQYKTISSGGMSLKLSDNDDLSSGITQFEYTLAGGSIWYDISNVNCLPFGLGICPFESTGMHLSSGSGCPTAVCQGGASTCHDAYTYPKDDWASLSCQPSADTVLNLCSSSSGGSSGTVNGIIGQVQSAAGAVAGALLGSDKSSSSSPPPAPTSTSTPTTTSTPTPTPTPESTPESKPTKQWSPPAVKISSESEAAVAVAAVPTTSSSTPPPPPKETPTKPSTTLTTSVMTQAPAQPNVAVVYETVTTMVSTTVVYQHKMFHKEKRGSPHAHARRHHHE